MMNKIKVSITLSHDLNATLRQLAKDHHTSYSAVVEEEVWFALLVKKEKQATELLGPQLQLTI
jgi:predicted transcriptional regulator